MDQVDQRTLTLHLMHASQMCSWTLLAFIKLSHKKIKRIKAGETSDRFHIECYACFVWFFPICYFLNSWSLGFRNVFHHHNLFIKKVKNLCLIITKRLPLNASITSTISLKFQLIYLTYISSFFQMKIFLVKYKSWDCHFQKKIYKII